ncbi:hypothetical protein A0H81_08275 [Grifola frondosa]|uniref:Uncharacterized protein n=1 Tax=Grifola frondosa TaxID=5627 RepID=A0A1C7M4D8_GRIFR|nr:hypothetical protein A0H81_08275 [Grifola frondosa]
MVRFGTTAIGPSDLFQSPLAQPFRLTSVLFYRRLIFLPLHVLRYPLHDNRILATVYMRLSSARFRTLGLRLQLRLGRDCLCAVEGTVDMSDSDVC